MDEYQIIEKLKKRIFVMTSNGRDSFVDMTTGAADLGEGHINWLLDNWGVDEGMRKKVTKSLGYRLLPLCKEVVYKPEENPVVRVDGFLFRNSWIRPLVQPSEESSKPFEDHLLRAMGCQDKVEYFLDLLAFKYQKPNEPKPHAVVYLYQAEGGHGKSLLATTLRHVFGESAVKIAPEAKLNSGSKVMLWTSTFLIAEEANVGRGSDIYDTIKTYSGTDELFDDMKHAHFQKHAIPANLIMISNNPPNFLEAHDRRFFVSEWKIDLEGDAHTAYFNEYVAWLESGGYAAIAGLLSRRDVKREMYAPVPMTDEKVRAMSMSLDGCVRELLDAMEDNPRALVFDQDNFSSTFEKFQVKDAQIKYKMQEAGLRQHDKRLQIGPWRGRPWYRTSHKIVAIKRTGSFIEGIPLEQALYSSVLEKSL